MILYCLLSEELFQIQLGLLLYSSFGSVFLFLTLHLPFFVFWFFPLHGVGCWSMPWLRLFIASGPLTETQYGGQWLNWLIHTVELMKPVGKLLQRSHYYTCYCSWSMNKLETIIAVYTVSVRVPSELILPFHVFLHPCSLVLI